ncbi:unnamed protein product [Amoebophrya sp. A25]|nr:unnamed protein product [Amoebophrya sp. A25]|eukprot:GSA25T00007165001.1
MTGPGATVATSTATFRFEGSTLARKFRISPDVPPIYATGLTAVVLSGCKTDEESSSVAIKVVDKDKLISSCPPNGGSELPRAQMEARLHEGLPPSPYVVPLLATEETRHAVILVMPFFTAGDLWGLIRYGDTVYEQETRNFLGQALRGLVLLHDQVGLVHGDLKPHNLLLDVVPSPSGSRTPIDSDVSDVEAKKSNPSSSTACSTSVGSGHGKYVVKLCDFGLSERMPCFVPPSPANRPRSPALSTDKVQVENTEVLTCAEDDKTNVLNQMNDDGPLKRSKNDSTMEVDGGGMSKKGSEQIGGATASNSIPADRISQKVGASSGVSSKTKNDDTNRSTKGGRWQAANYELKKLDKTSCQCAIPFTGLRGTSGYFSPEMLGESDYGPGVDVFALGICAFRMIAGYEPFYPPSNFGDGAVFEETYWAHVSDECKGLLSKMLAVEPRQRITAREALSHPWFSVVLDTSKAGPKYMAPPSENIRFHDPLELRDILGATPGAEDVVMGGSSA